MGASPVFDHHLKSRLADNFSICVTISPYIAPHGSSSFIFRWHLSRPLATSTSAGLHSRLYSWPAHSRDHDFRGATHPLLRSLSTELTKATEKEALQNERSEPNEREELSHHSAFCPDEQPRILLDVFGPNCALIAHFKSHFLLPFPTSIQIR